MGPTTGTPCESVLSNTVLALGGVIWWCGGGPGVRWLVGGGCQHSEGATCGAVSGGPWGGSGAPWRTTKWTSTHPSPTITHPPPTATTTPPPTHPARPLTPPNIHHSPPPHPASGRHAASTAAHSAATHPSAHYLPTATHQGHYHPSAAQAAHRRQCPVGGFPLGLGTLRDGGASARTLAWQKD